MKRSEHDDTEINFQCIVDIQLAVQTEVPNLFSHENNAIFVFNVKNILYESTWVPVSVRLATAVDCAYTPRSLSLPPPPLSLVIIYICFVLQLQYSCRSKMVSRIISLVPVERKIQ